MNDLPYYIRAVQTSNIMDDSRHWLQQEEDAGYCLDAPDVIPTPGVRIVYVPASRDVPVSTAPNYSNRG